MKHVDMIVKSVRPIALDTYEMCLQNDYIANMAQPGQFLHLLVDGHTLRRPLSIANTDLVAGMVTILFKTTGDGTRRLAAYMPGARLDVLGPAGNGFHRRSETIKTALLIGGGIGVPPLYFLGKDLQKKGVHVTAVLGFQSNAHIFYEQMFRQLGKTYIVTNDGSYGGHGLVTDALDQVGAIDHYFACGPVPMLRAVTQELGSQAGSISLEERMGCGIGACFACVIPSHNDSGYRKICRDGPVFPAGEVVL
ncbi:dihydroorotate dehydrogenase electron transfer subunit [Lentibacillus salinarum]|uniref:Dihydroorotate dehydrogenase B (NAD(+)), electron transfer subunit n=1 Tax=Lentibacillus salinarum TaxID=446820 RepID=A0ABW3ZQ38_9BACI